MRNALKTLLALRSDWVVCGEAQDANEAITKAAELRPDLVVLDYKMHDSNGLTAAHRILKMMPEVPIVMFTLYKTDELEHAANLIGIRRVIGKEDDVNTLLYAIETELNSPSLR